MLMMEPKGTRKPVQPIRAWLESLETRAVPAIVAVDDTPLNGVVYNAVPGQTLSVSKDLGVLANDFTTAADLGKQLIASLDFGLFPANIPGAKLTLNPDGSFEFFIPAGTQPQPFTFSYKASILGQAGTEQSAQVLINVLQPPTKLFVAAPDSGGGPIVRVFNANNGIERFTLQPFESRFRGGVNVAVGDLNNDGQDEIIVGAGVGGGPVVVVYDSNGLEVSRFFAYSPNFRGGVSVAVGDLDGDGNDELITAAGPGGGPHVRVFDTGFFTTGATNLLFTSKQEFFAYDPAFRGGVNIAAGDVFGFGRDFIITGAGTGGGPMVRIFDPFGNPGTNVPNSFDPSIPANYLTTPIISAAFFAYDPSNRGGVTVAAGNFGNGRDSIVTGPGEGNPVVNVYDGPTLALLRSFVANSTDNATAGVFLNGQTVNPLGSGFPGTNGALLSPATIPGALTGGNGTGFSSSLSAGQNGGARVSTVDRTGDGIDDIIVGSGPGSVGRVRIFDGATGTEVDNFVAFDPNFLGGIEVAGSNRRRTIPPI